jgi:two-component system KDP operon response regulator KdpE
MKVLVIEDNPGIVEAISLAFELRWPGVQTVSTAQGLKGVELVESEAPDVVILDLGLPDIEGFEVLRQTRQFSDAPVIILTVRGEEIDKIKGLELGADDYITKPFSHMEFLARVKAVLRRSQMPELKGNEKPFVRGELVIDFASREVTLAGKPVRLTPTEYNLLYYLVRNEGKVLSQQALLRKVWGEEYTDATEYIKKYIQRLRAKLGDDPQNPRMLLSERGVGYKFLRPL